MRASGERRRAVVLLGACLALLTCAASPAGAASPIAPWPSPPTTRPLPPGPVVVLPAGAPRPTVRVPVAPLPPVGDGAAPRVTRVPDAVWALMQGRSWRPGCVDRGRLRYVTVNYWGFDGRRHRGELVMAASAAWPAARAFSRLYALHFPIRSMVLVDHFGRNRRLPGADDYASMAADNTSGFNCRYIDGKERIRAWSPHAFGIALDINPWENPYVSRVGVLPDRWWLPRTRPGVELFRRGSAAVRALALEGFVWGASYGDMQHFQR